MNRVVFNLDASTVALVETMAKTEGVAISQISREALVTYLKKFKEGCITTRAGKTA